jgi:NitT/TauT family transport system ATP-binding protein
MMNAQVQVESSRRPQLADAAPLITISSLTKEFASKSGESVVALAAIDLEIGVGEFLSVVGPSGCGKTTLLRILGGLERASGGGIRIGTRSVAGPRDDVAIVFQQPTLLPWYTVLDNVLLPAKLKGDDARASRERADQLLELVGLADFQRKYPFELSGGMQQRVAICRALIRDPKILLMDEPFGALDAMKRETMNVELMRWWSREPKTVVFITHSISEAVLLGDRVVVMSPRPGRISHILDIDIARPRDLATMGAARFGELCGEVRSIFGAHQLVTEL